MAKRRSCPLSLHCSDMGALRGRPCVNWDTCNWWVQPWRLPYEFKSLKSEGLSYLSVKWADSFEQPRWQEAGWAAAEPLPFVHLKASDGCRILYVNRSRGDWDKAELLGKKYLLWAAAQSMNYTEFYEFDPDVYEDWLYKEPWYNVEQIH